MRIILTITNLLSSSNAHAKDSMRSATQSRFSRQIRITDVLLHERNHGIRLLQRLIDLLRLTIGRPPQLRVAATVVLALVPRMVRDGHVLVDGVFDKVAAFPVEVRAANEDGPCSVEVGVLDGAGSCV